MTGAGSGSIAPILALFVFNGIICQPESEYGSGREMAATPKASAFETVVIGSTIFPLSLEVRQCMDQLNRQRPMPRNSGAWVSNCVKDQRTTTAAPGQPTFVNPYKEEIKVSETKTAVLPCEIDNRGNHSVEWLKQSPGSETLFYLNGLTGVVSEQASDLRRFSHQFNKSISSFADIGIFNIRITNVRGSDAGLYYCSIKTKPELTSKLINLVVEIPVAVTRILPDYPPYANITWPNTRFINETDTANLICETKGTETINIVWMFQNTCEPCDSTKCSKHYPCYGSRCGSRYNVDEEIPERLVFKRTLTIPGVSREYTGCYKCEAQNSKAIDQKHFKLIVQFKPRIRVDRTDVRGGPKGFVTLQCYIESFPPARVVWKTQNGTILQTDENIDSDSSRFIFVNLDESDYGNYTCEASNILGSSSSEIELSGRPLAPRITSHNTSRRKHAYELCWVRGDEDLDNNMIKISTIKYVAKYRGEWVAVYNDSYMRMVYSHEDPLKEIIYTEYEQKYYCYTLRDLRPNTNYTIWLHAENRYGVGNSTVFTIRTVNEDIPTTTAEAMTPAATTAIGGPQSHLVGSNAATQYTKSSGVIMIYLLIMCALIHIS